MAFDQQFTPTGDPIPVEFTHFTPTGDPIHPDHVFATPTGDPIPADFVHSTPRGDHIPLDFAHPTPTGDVSPLRRIEQPLHDHVRESAIQGSIVPRPATGQLEEASTAEPAGAPTSKPYRGRHTRSKKAGADQAEETTVTHYHVTTPLFEAVSRAVNQRWRNPQA